MLAGDLDGRDDVELEAVRVEADPEVGIFITSGLKLNDQTC